MNAETIKRIVDDERVERLTAQLCRHWDVATERLEELVQDLNEGMDTCAEAEIYAALMRMQSAIMALMELNKLPCTYLFTAYLERIAKTVSNEDIRGSVVKLIEQLFSKKSAQPQTSFFDMVNQSMAQHFALSPEHQATIQQKVMPMQQIFAICAQHLKSTDLMMFASIIQELNTEGNAMEHEETIQHLKKMLQAMDTLATQMNENLQMMLIWLGILTLLPSMMVSLMQQSQCDSKAMANLFNKVLVRVRESNAWWNYWKEHRDTLRVVSDDSSWKDIMTAERSKERKELGLVPGGLFAKWTTDREAFDAAFLDAHLDDDALRHFIFHLATLSEITRELDPTSKFGDEQLVMDNLQRVGDAVLEAAHQLDDLVDKAWYPHYGAMWQELIQNETIFAHLKVTRKSPHNNLFTARFFCHLVGEMKKSAVFGAHSDGDLAAKLTKKQYVGTFRKNIQEGMGEEAQNVNHIFNTIYQKYNQLAHPKK
jgi:hypothetical protein